MDTSFIQIPLSDGGLFLFIGVGSLALILFRRACQTNVVCPKNTKVTDLWGHYGHDETTRRQIESLTTRLNSKPPMVPEWDMPGAYTAAHR